MARLLSSFRARNRTTRDFRAGYARLTTQQQLLVRRVAVDFDSNPNRAGFRLHQLRDTSNSHHHPDSWSVSVTMGIRAVFIVDNGIRVWYWIGTHADYDKLVGQ
jgi:hypothetical protein